MSETVVVTVTPRGIRAIYHDALSGLAGQGPTVRRASHVEPHPDGGWTADMAPSGGPVLFAPDGKPFVRRQDALDAEVAWLREHLKV